METINFIDPFFSYQVIFICNLSKNRIIFTGETGFAIDDLLIELHKCIDISIRDNYNIESVVYQPLNNKDYGTKKTE